MNVVNCQSVRKVEYLMPTHNINFLDNNTFVRFWLFDGILKCNLYGLRNTLCNAFRNTRRYSLDVFNCCSFR